MGISNIGQAGLWLSATLAVLGQAAPADAQVRITAGLVEGVAEGGIVAYKGIPFAAPPVGDLRWREPRPVKHWPGVLNADRYKPQCQQSAPPLPFQPREETSEDCLYLNIWAPADAGKPKSHPKAVMIFLHGGGFRSGSPSTPLYWGDKLAGLHDVIVVNLAYRHGTLGFLAHPGLSAESEDYVSGNYGLLDMIAGLKWVRGNIGAFGGDPRNVTVFGHSAGAWAMSKLMVSPLAQGLFDKVITQSGGDFWPVERPSGMLVLKNAERAGVAFADSLGVRSIAELRRIPAARITEAPFPGLPDKPHVNAALPNVDGHLIPDDAYTLFSAAKQAKVPLLIGYNADEASWMIRPKDRIGFIAETRSTYGVFADRILSRFPAGTEPEAKASQVSLASEIIFGWHIWTWARLHARTAREQPVFFYHFVAEQNGHGAELPFVFMHPFGGPETDAFRRSSQQIAAYWTNFAKTGNPNGTGLVHWPAFDERTLRVMTLGRTFAAKTMPDLAAHRLIDEYVASTR